MDTSEKVRRAAKAAAAAAGNQRKLAAMMNVHESAVSLWIKGEEPSLKNYFRLMEIAKKAKTPAVIVLAVLTAAAASIYSKPSDASALEMQTAGKTNPAVYYVKYSMTRELQPILSHPPV